MGFNSAFKGLNEKPHKMFVVAPVGMILRIASTETKSTPLATFNAVYLFQAPNWF